MASQPSINFLDQSQSGNIDFDADTLKVILMKSGFSFNQDTDGNYSDVSVYELANGNGYTTGGVIWTSVVVTPDIVNNRSRVSGASAQWTASGGTIGPSPGAIIYKDTGSPSTSTVIGYIQFDGGEQSAGAPTTFTVSEIYVDYTSA